jgi:hypothetical protein
LESTMAKEKTVSPLAKALLAGAMRKVRLMDKATYEKITLRHLRVTGTRFGLPQKSSVRKSTNGLRSS